MLRALTRFCYHRRGTVVIAWVALLVGLFVLNAVAGGAYRTEFGLPGSETDEANAILNRHGFNARTGDTAQVVFAAEQGIADPAVRTAIEGLLAAIGQRVPDAALSSPYSPEGTRQVAANGKVAYAEINLAKRTAEGYSSIADKIKAERAAVSVPGLRIELGGDMFADQSMPASEAIGVVAAIIILLVASSFNLPGKAFLARLFFGSARRGTIAAATGGAPK